MIIKILPTEGRTFRGVILYNLKEGSELIAVERCPADAIAMTTRFENIADLNRRVANPVFHVAISFAYDESDIAESKATDIIRDYMEGMGYGEQPYSLFRHTDKKHIHYHIVSSRVGVVDNKKIKDGNEKRKSLKLLGELIFKYGLKHQLISRNGLVWNLNTLVTEVMRSDRPYSLHSLQSVLREEGIKVDKTDKGGYVFYFIDESKSMHGIFSSELDAFKQTSLKRRLNANKYYRAKADTRIRDVIDTVLSEERSLSEYMKMLRDEKIFVNLDRNNSGIYGVSYRADGFVFKGSELRGNYSWNDLNQHIVEKPKPIKPFAKQPLSPARPDEAGFYVGSVSGVRSNMDDIEREEEELKQK